ncbi:dihydrodipicolinate synthase family protein [Oxalobacteraceae bacterium CAVE-383]|nr:dihydrodipicolinate synthase family protein [Oxalobacteraceae bacterium CAVE-383]
MKIPGLAVPPLTPFNSDLKVDEALLKGEIDYVIDSCNAAVVVAAGVEAQEYHFLTMDERKNLISKTIEFVGKRRPVAVGISHPSYRTAIELAHFAEKQGADMIQLLAPLRPFGGEPTRAELVSYFEMVSRESSLPMMLYLNPGPGANVDVNTTIELAALDKVKYVKESSRDLSRVGLLIERIDQGGLAAYLTTIQMLLITLELGGSGAAIPPPAAELGARILEAFQAGDRAEAVRLQRQFSYFPSKWMHRGLTPTMKATMKILGRSIGEPYPPFNTFTEEEIGALTTYIQSTDLTPKGK